MDIKFWSPVLVCLALSVASVQAMADSNWSYDESSQTIISSFDSSPVPQSSSHADDGIEHNTGLWYYDEDSDTVVFSSEGSRTQHVQSNPSNDVPVFEYDIAFLDQ